MDTFDFEPVNLGPQGKAINLAFARELDQFLKEQGALADVHMADRDGKLVNGEGYRYVRVDTPLVPAVEMAQEDYRRLVRLAQVGPAAVVAIDDVARFDDRDPNAYNIVADISGSDPKAGYVMVGAHLDSWAAADGAADNGAGAAAVMEAARILSTLGVRPKRTIRFALWAGEEQGLRGSIAYVEEHIAKRGPDNAPLATGVDRYFTWTSRWPITPRPGYKDLYAYFNLDHGSGKIRGVSAGHNPEMVPILRGWRATSSSAA